MDNSNQFLGTERIGKLMKQYAIPCIISLLVGACIILLTRFLLQMPVIWDLTEMLQTQLYFH